MGIKEFFQTIQWGATLQVAAIRIVIASILWSLLSLVLGNSNAGEFLPLVFGLILVFVVFMAIAIPAIGLARANVPYIGLAALPAWMVVIADPIVKLIHGKHPEWVPVVEFKFINPPVLAVFGSGDSQIYNEVAAEDSSTKSDSNSSQPETLDKPIEQLESQREDSNETSGSVSDEPALADANKSAYEDVIQAIRIEDWAGLQRSLPDVNARDPGQFFQRGLPHPFVEAAEQSGASNVSPAIDILVDAGFDLNLELNNEDEFLRGWRLIGGAALRANTRLLSHLIDKGAEIEWPTKKGDNFPPLSTVCAVHGKKVEYIAMINSLIDAGSTLNPSGFPPPLHCLVSAGRDAQGQPLLDAAKLLINNGADPNFVGRVWSFNGNMDKCGPPLFAYWNSGFELVEYLIEQGADPEAKADTGETMRDFFLRYSDWCAGDEEELVEIRKILSLVDAQESRVI